MSHFSVAVFSDGKKTVKELLAPYQENNMGDCPKKYLKFVSAVEREHERYETGSMNIVCLQDGKYVFPWNIVDLKSIFSYTIFTDGTDHLHIAASNGRFCGAKRPQCEADRPQAVAFVSRILS